MITRMPRAWAASSSLLEIIHCPVFWIDVVIIGDRVSMVGRGRVDRHEPDAGDAEICGCGGIPIIKIIQFLDDAVDVSDPITITIIERSYEDLVENTIIPPGIAIGALRQPGDGSYGNCFENLWGSERNVMVLEGAGEIVSVGEGWITLVDVGAAKDKSRINTGCHLGGIRIQPCQGRVAGNER
jgi:hypothetical protein